MEQHLSPLLQGFLKRRQAAIAPDQGLDEMVTINDAVGAVAFYYEKVRNVVEFNDEHLLRQNAIRRILSRRLIFQQEQREVAMALLKELVRSRYFRNNAVPVSRVEEIVAILGQFEGVASALRRRNILSDQEQSWLYAMAACAIDETLSPMIEEEALIHLMYGVVVPTIQLSTAQDPGEKIRKMQTYLAVYKVLMKPDIHRLRYFILKNRYPTWHWFGTENPEVLAAQFREVYMSVEDAIHHPLNKKLSISMARFRIPFVVLHTVLKNNTEDLLLDAAALEKEVRRICEGFYNVQRRRLVRRTTRAFVYLFLTKMLLGLGMEIPYDLFFIGVIHWLPVVLNTVVPPIILVSIALSAPKPKKTNTDAIVQAIREIVYSGTERTIFIAQPQKIRRASVAMNALFFIMYTATFVVSFGLVYWVLQELHFNWVSKVVFFAFLSLVTFFAVNLRRSARELIIIRPKLNLITASLDLLILPVMKVGYWLSGNIAKINIFVFIFDVLVEVPLQALIEITEEWFSFIKEKKEELE